MATSTTSRVGSSGGPKTDASGGKGGGTEDGAAAPEKKSKKKLIIMVAVGLLVVGGGAYETVLKPKPAPLSAAQQAAAAAKKPPVYGPIVPLAEQTLNLADGHYLKLTAVIQLKKTATFVAPDAGTVTPAMSAAAQAIITTYSAYTQAQLTGSAAQAKATAVLIKALNPIFPEEIAGVYMTEFLMSS
jgi:flagellar FliL protein